MHRSYKETDLQFFISESSGWFLYCPFADCLFVFLYSRELWHIMSSCGKDAWGSQGNLRRGNFGILISDS